MGPRVLGSGLEFLSLCDFVDSPLFTKGFALLALFGVGTNRNTVREGPLSLSFASVYSLVFPDRTNE